MLELSQFSPGLSNRKDEGNPKLRDGSSPRREDSTRLLITKGYGSGGLLRRLETVIANPSAILNEVVERATTVVAALVCRAHAKTISEVEVNYQRKRRRHFVRGRYQYSSTT